ncbi:MAG TPA: hypothetical protein ENN17_03160 [bacterium]|nr:hypothetical protein [bacterium]
MTRQTRRLRGEINQPLPFSKTNWVLFFSGILTLVVGYIALSIGPWDSFWSLTLAPILLVIGYCVLIPVAILYRRGEKDDKPVRS